MRLIDADEFEKQIAGMAIANNYPFSKVNALCKLIDQQPTAYDVNEVVKQLENELQLADKEKDRCARENLLQFDTAKGYAHAIAVVIEIVKGGGVDVRSVAGLEAQGEE